MKFGPENNEHVENLIQHSFSNASIVRIKKRENKTKTIILSYEIKYSFLILVIKKPSN